MEKLNLQLSKMGRICGILLLVVTLTGCPGEEDCYDFGKSARINDLIIISPSSSTYNQGDTVSYKCEISSENEYFGSKINLFEKTKDFNARLYANPIFFEGNSVTIKKGSLEINDGWVNEEYNPVNQKYELEIEIKLQKKGLYSMISGEYIEFQGNSECNRYRLDTNIQGMNQDGKIEFTVE